MSGFKLLAIRPLKGCDKKFSKVLKHDRLYKFYQDYTFSFKNNIIIGVDYSTSVPESLYDIDRKNQKRLHLNISAIVGKNGSGKSSLLDLFYVSNFLLADQEGILNVNSSNIQDHLSSLSKLRTKYRNELTLLNRKKVFDDLLKNNQGQNERKTYFDLFTKEKTLHKTIKVFHDRIESLESLKQEIENLKSSIKVEIYYQTNNTVYCLKVDCENPESQLCTIKKVASNFEKFNDENLIGLNGKYDLSSHFVYSVALNYSHYSLNAGEIGVWINELFHKNDGYQTPIVINPMREKGIIDINNENHLVRSRLLSNLFSPIDFKMNDVFSDKWWEIVNNSPRKLAETKIAIRIKIEIDDTKVSKSTSLNKKDKELWKKIEYILLPAPRIKRQETEWDEYAKAYIISKMTTIAENYDLYKAYLIEGRLIGNKIVDYANELLNSKSHVSYKFKQALNFLKFDYAQHYNSAQHVSDISFLSKCINNLKIKEDVIEIVPPSFLKVDVIFSAEGEDLSNSLNSLSSGERQKIYSLSSITYHLKYIDSVVQSDKVPLKYKHINLLFDEIELYYHPDLQRTFISDLRTAISRVKLVSIESVNCVFATHSPFILSDIPTENILQLNPRTDNHLKTTRTFGANIHDLLRDSFFMDNGVTGSFSKSKINELINYLANNRISINSKKYKMTAEKAEQIIMLIGEPLLRDALLESLEIKKRLNVR